MTAACPRTEVLARLAHFGAAGDPAAHAHVEGCAQCRERIRTLREVAGTQSGVGSGPTHIPAEAWDDDTAPSGKPLRAEGEPRPDDASTRREVLQKGTEVDRYVVLDVLGIGGAGVVYAAYDPELDRKVALKLLSLRTQLDSENDARARLLREAQAMAKLAHPHVVAIHDAGTYEGHVFIAMEFVRGGTLREWLREPHSVDAIVSAFGEAGRGLNAAHQAGLVHRDFKPENVLVTPEGAMKVSDFGLVRATGEPERTPKANPADSGAMAMSLITPLTVDGAILGTPGYMAPEQVRGGTATAASDQFSFCVSLYEALYGRRPFEGKTIGELMVAALEGRILPPPPEIKVKRRIHEAVVRGLSPDPNQRFPSMRALLAEIAPRQAFTRRHWLALARSTTVLAMTAVGGAFLYSWHSKRCEGADATATSVWNAARKSAIERAFVATGLPFAKDVFAGVVNRTDTWSEAWRTARRESCEATIVRREQPEALMLQRQVCLDAQLTQLRELTRLWEGADPRSVQEAVQAAASLPPVEDCSAAAVLRANKGEVDGRTSQQRDEVLAMLAALRAQLSSRTDTAPADADAAVDAARALGDRRLQAEALVLKAQVQTRAGDFAVAERTLRDAARAAEASHNDEAAATARIMLFRSTGFLSSRFAEAHLLSEDARAAVERADRDELWASYATSQGDLLRAEGRYEEALKQYDEALRRRRRMVPAGDPALADLLDRVGVTYMRKGELEKARDNLESALRIYEASVGPHHPEYARVLVDKGLVEFRKGNTTEAAALQQRALQIREKVLGPDHADLAPPLTNLGNVLRAAGRYDEALQHQLRALTLFERRYGDIPRLAPYLVNVAEAYLELGRAADALPHAQRSVELRARGLPADHPDHAWSLLTLGRTWSLLGRPREALLVLERALKLREKALGPDHALVADALDQLAAAHHRRGDLAREIPLLERSVELRGRTSQDPGAQASAAIALSRALWEHRRDEPRARELLQKAKALLAEGVGAQATRTELEALLAELDRT